MRDQQTDYHRNGQSVGEELPNISGGARAAGGSGPAKPMSEILPDVLTANSMFDNVRREVYTESPFGCKFAEHEVFRRQIIFDALDAAQGIQHAPSRHNGRANGKLCAFHEH